MTVVESKKLHTLKRRRICRIKELFFIDSGPQRPNNLGGEFKIYQEAFANMMIV